MPTPIVGERVLHSRRTHRISFWGAITSVLLALLLTLSTVPGSALAEEIMSPSGLRDTLNFLGQEHVYLTSTTLGDLLRGDTIAYGASLTRLYDNSGRLSETVGAIYGPEAESTFRSLWQAHYDGYLDYALGASAREESMKVQAREGLDSNRAALGSFFASHNPNLRGAAVSASLREQVNYVTNAIDAMADQEWGRAFAQIHLAAFESAEFADPIAEAISLKFSDKMNGGVTGPAAEMSAAFTRLVQEHVYLNSMTTGSIAIGNMSRAEAGMATSRNNTRALSTLIGKMYNDDVGRSFESLWNEQLDLYADYTRAELAGDTESINATRARLASWVTETSSLLNDANPFFSHDSVASVLSNHVSMTLNGIDAQVARDWRAAYSGLQLNAHQSLDVANVVAGGITDAFGEQSGAQVLPLAEPQDMP
jgi:hypothetical protein